MTNTQSGVLAEKLTGNCVNGYMSDLNGNQNSRDQIEKIDGDYSDESDVDAKSTGNEGPLWLGFAEKPQEDSFSQRDSCPNKAGGSPIWLDPVHLPSGRSFVCGFCEEPLQYVLQVDAPISEIESAYYRAIFVFMCPSMSCLRRDQLEQQKSSQEDVLRSVKVFRCQLPHVNPFYPSKDQSDLNCTDHSPPAAALCSGCRTWRGDHLCNGCRTIYCSNKHKVIHSSSGHEGDCQLPEFASEVTKKVGSKTLWPEFELIFEQSRESNASTSNCNDNHDSLATVPSTCNGDFNAPTSVQETDEESISEYFEVDEEKKILASFFEAIEEDPYQVLRCWTSKGKPLWRELNGRPSATNIPKCSYCSGPMRFEFQIMPQLLHFFRIDDSVDPLVWSLNWSTIAVYTCEASCDSGVVYKEEFPWVQLDS